MLVLRALHIVVVALLASIAYGFGRLRTLLVRDREERERAVGRLRGRILRHALASLGATFVKLGQVMSTRIDLFSKEIIEELQKLQDRLAPFPFARVQRILEEDLGAPVASIFRELDATPVAAASVAQVHRGVLLDGTEVAVKVLRPRVRERALADGAVLGLGARLLELHPDLRLSKPVAHLEELEKGIVDQTDLRIEAANYARFRANFVDVPYVVFPRVYDAHSSARVLTMEFLRGTKVDALPPGDHGELAHRLSHSFMKMVFEDGFLHADLHPGNFLVLDDGRVAMFDVGLAKALTPERLDEFVDFNRCLAMGTPEDLLNHVRTYHDYMEGTVDWEALGRDLDALVATFRGKTKEELEISEFLDTTFALGRKYRVRPVTELALIMVGVMTAEGVGKMIDAKTDFLGDIATFLMPLLARRVAAVAAEEAARAEAAEEAARAEAAEEAARAEAANAIAEAI